MKILFMRLSAINILSIAEMDAMKMIDILDNMRKSIN